MTDPLSRLTAALADRYRLERELGAGGMATVYLAQDVRHDRRVAVKVLRPELAALIGADRFLAEIRTTANLQHPHILPLFDSGQTQHQDGGDTTRFLYYVMPYVEGESLRDRLDRERQLPVADALRIAGEVADALDYAHRHGVIHRDIKPENVLLHDGRALVADFGIALAVDSAGAGTRMTETGLSLGTPHYMSPEQAMGEREITARSDVYALGCVLYEMLVGEPPFTGPTAQAIIARVMTEEPRSLTVQRRTIPPHVEAAVRKSLEKLPADRFQAASGFSAALTVPATGATTVPMTAAPGIQAGARRVDWRLAAAGVLVALGLGAAGATRWRAPAPAEQLGRFAIQIEPITTLGAGFSQQVALSPDGTVLAFVGRGARGAQIFLRAWSDSVPRILQGTENCTGPFFSPDGRRLGCWSPQRLQWVPVDGGAPTLIADSAGAWAAWMADGRVVYTDPIGQSLRITEPGGTTREVIRSDTAQFLAITPLPGGKSVLVALLMGGRNRAEIAAVSLEDGTMKTVGLPDVVMARYAADGHVVFQRRVGGPLMAAPFDLGALQIRGEPRQVAPAARVTFRVVAQWDAAGDNLVYVPVAPLELVMVGRDGRSTTLQSEPRSYHHPRFSPDGRRIALDITDPETRDVWITDVQDGRMTRLTVSEVANDPFWSPDGRRVAYTAVRGTVRGVFLRNADGSGARDSIFITDHDQSSGSWSPDGRTLVTATALTAGLWTVPLDGPDAAAVIPGSRSSEAYPAFSRDGRWLAYVSDESGRQEVYVRPYPGPGGRIQVSVNGGTEAVWSWNGRELIYREDTGTANRFMVAAVRTSPTFEVLSRTPMFDAGHYVTAEDHANYDIHPDGQRFVMVHSLQATQIQLIQHWVSQLVEP